MGKFYPKIINVPRFNKRATGEIRKARYIAHSKTEYIYSKISGLGALVPEKVSKI